MIADLTDMDLIRKCNKGVKFLMCVIDYHSKYSCVVTMKNKKDQIRVVSFKIDK